MKILVKLPAIALFILFFSCDIGIESSYPKSDWTIMMYLADDYRTIGLFEDLKEAVYNQQNTSNIRLVILYDGPSSQADVSGPSIIILDSPFSYSYRVIPLESIGFDIDIDGEIDLSSQDNLEKYISYSKKMLPADNYALFFGSHGTGFQSSAPSGLAVEYDIQEDSGLLTVEEISSAVKNQGGVNLVNFDACDIGNIESIYQFKGTGVEYIIASPEVIPSLGNQYTKLFLDIYNQTELTTESLGRSVLESYSEFYENTTTTTSYIIYGSSETNTEPTSYFLQMYSVDKIVNLVESSNFKNDLGNFTSNINSSSTNRLYNFESININYVYYYPNYVDLYDLYSYTTELDNCIITPLGATRKYFSIYVPTYSFNSNYKNTLFDVETGWSANIETISSSYYP